MKNLESIFNELLSLSLHFIVLLMSFDNVNKENENLINAAVYNVLIIWVINSVFTIAKFILKIIEFAKSRLNKSKVEPEPKKEITVSNLDT